MANKEKAKEFFLLFFNIFYKMTKNEEDAPEIANDYNDLISNKFNLVEIIKEKVKILFPKQMLLIVLAIKLKEIL